MSEPQKIRLTLSSRAEKYVRRDAPVEARRMAAGGALPLEPVELATVLFALLHDPDDEVKSKARESLEALPDSVANTVLSGRTNPRVLSWLAQAWKDDEKRMERLALNPHSDDETYAFLATLPHRIVIEIVAGNQTRMLRSSEILDALGANPLTFLGLAGVGDLTLTCNGELSRNRQMGLRLATGARAAEVAASQKAVAEGYVSAPAVHRLALREGVEMPIAEAVYRVCYEDADVRKEAARLMTREMKDELAGVFPSR